MKFSTIFCNKFVDSVAGKKFLDEEIDLSKGQIFLNAESSGAVKISMNNATKIQNIKI